MREIFLILAAVGVVLLGITVYQGQKGDPRDRSSLHPHIGWALGSGIYTVILHSIVITYFMGTGFAVKEAVDEYEIDEVYLQHARNMKIKVFPLTTLAILGVVISVIMGTAQFTSSNPGGTHKFLAYLTVMLNFFTFYLQFQSITENGRLLEEISERIPEEAT